MSSPMPNSGTYAPPATVVRRRAFSLSVGERILAFAGASVVWLWLHILENALLGDEPELLTLSPFPLWLSFVLCNLFAASSLCALRFARRIETRDVSRAGYLSFGFPAAQVALVFLCVPLGFLALVPLAASFPAHIGVSVAASARLFQREDNRGDAAAFPFCLAWYFALGFLLRHISAFD